MRSAKLEQVFARCKNHFDSVKRGPAFQQSHASSNPCLKSDFKGRPSKHQPPPGKQRSSAAHYAIRSNGSRQKQPDRELPLANQKENFRRREAAQQAKYWVNRGLALGKARHGNHRDGLIHSIGTKRNYEGALTRFCRWIQQHKFRDLESVSIKNTMRYLEERSTQVGQKTLDLDRQAIQFLLRQTTGAEMRLERIKSTFHRRAGN